MDKKVRTGKNRRKAVKRECKTLDHRIQSFGCHPSRRGRGETAKPLLWKKDVGNNSDG